MAKLVQTTSYLLQMIGDILYQFSIKVYHWITYITRNLTVPYNYKKEDGPLAKLRETVGYG